MNQPTTPRGSAGSPNEKSGSVLARLRQRGQTRPEEVGATQQVDALTGIPGRQGLTEALGSAIDQSKRQSSVAVLAFVEIGQLRDINDTFGPDIGDQLLQMAAARLQTIDLPGTYVIRYEGAVFGIVFPDIPNLTGAEETGRFLVELMAAPFSLGSEQLTVGVYVGAAVSTDNYSSLDEMVRDAYQSLVRARESGLGAYVVHDESKRARYSTRIDDRRLHKAIENHEFHLHYQPIVRVDTGELVGVESLIRWSQPGATNVGMLFPHDFLPLLEKSGMIVQVGAWVIDETCRQLDEWLRAYPDQPLYFASCNIGARQLADPGFIDTVRSALTNHGLEPPHLCLDLTEEALRYNEYQRERAWSSLRVLKNDGVKLGLDDFGTGMASLAHLREFRLDVLHLHRSFISGLGVNREDDAIVKHVTALAHELECIVIGEGVETEKQERMLVDTHVDLAQGFRYGRPSPAAEITARLDPTQPRDTTWDSSQVFEHGV